MAARLRKRHDENSRAAIQTTQLIKRLMYHALGRVAMSPSQIQAANILLRKVLPDLSAAEVNNNVTVNYVDAIRAASSIGHREDDSEMEAASESVRH